MAGRQVNRVELMHFLNTTPGGGTPTWDVIGEGHPNLSTAYNPTTETQQWINQRTGTTTVQNYAPVIDAEQIAHAGDPVFDFVDEISWKLKTGADAETDYLEVRAYNATGGTSYPARRFRVSISIDTEGDAATDPVSRSYNINFMGDPIFGTFNPSTNAFTPEV